MFMYYVRRRGVRTTRFVYPVLFWLTHFFILDSPLPLSFSFLSFSFFPFFFLFACFLFVFFLFRVVLPNPGKIDGPEGFKRIKLYTNTPKIFWFRIDSFSSNVGQSVNEIQQAIDRLRSRTVSSYENFLEHRPFSVHQHGQHQYWRGEVMWKWSICRCHLSSSSRACFDDKWGGGADVEEGEEGRWNFKPLYVLGLKWIHLLVIIFFILS